MKIVLTILLSILILSDAVAKEFGELLAQSPPEVSDVILVNYGQSINTMFALTHIEKKDLNNRNLELFILRAYLREQTKDALQAAKNLRSKRKDYKSQYGYFCRILNDDISSYIKDNQITKEEINQDGLRDVFLQSISFCNDLKKNSEVNEEYVTQ
jgi:hypothetical protein